MEGRPLESGALACLLNADRWWCCFFLYTREMLRVLLATCLVRVTVILHMLCYGILGGQVGGWKTSKMSNVIIMLSNSDLTLWTEVWWERHMTSRSVRRDLREQESPGRKEGCWGNHWESTVWLWCTLVHLGFQTRSVWQGKSLDIPKLKATWNLEFFKLVLTKISSIR